MLSEHERYYLDVDDGETFHITKHLLRVDQDVKTLDVKIFELKENPDNIQLLYDIMALIYA